MTTPHHPAQFQGAATIELPFKPFTLDEVSRMTKVPARYLDNWLMTGAVRHTRGSGVEGLDYMATFACYVGRRYLEEGADAARASRVVRMLAGTLFEQMANAIQGGRTFPVPAASHAPTPGDRDIVLDCFVPAPPGKLGSTLRIDKLHDEFRHELDREFPPSSITIVT